MMQLNVIKRKIYIRGLDLKGFRELENQISSDFQSYLMQTSFDKYLIYKIF